MTLVLKLQKTHSHDFHNSDELTCLEYSLYKRLQEEGPCTFTWLLNEYFELNEADPDEAFYRKMRFPSYALNSPHKVQSL